jgi:hypothetical protein
MTAVRPSRPARRSPARLRAGALVTLAALALASGCTTDEAAVGAQPSPRPSVVPLPIPTVSVAPAEQPASAAFRTSGEAVLPDLTLTPGAAFPDVDRAALCDPHYAQGVRQPQFNDKVAAFTAYGISIHSRDQYQVDRLIPVALGGSNAAANLWPQPFGSRGAAQKDELESKLRLLVCSGALDLATAQRAIATDWSSALDTYLPLPERQAPDPGTPADPYEVKNGAPCPVEGAVGFTANKSIRFTCQRQSDGTLSWGKRYA